MSRLVVTDRGLKREALKVSALDDQDAIRLGDLYFHSDDGVYASTSSRPTAPYCPPLSGVTSRPGERRLSCYQR